MDAHLLVLIVLAVVAIAGVPLLIFAVLVERKVRLIHKQLVKISEYIED